MLFAGFKGVLPVATPDSIAPRTGDSPMLHMQASRSVEGAKNYFRTALRTSDYLVKDAVQEPGYWYGAAAEYLGLGQGEPINEKDFIALLENRHPDTGERITPRTKADRIPGYEFRFDLPGKSVAMMAMVDPTILTLFKQSVEETLSEAESEMRVRVDQDGSKSERLTGNMISGMFFHDTARPVGGVPDYHPHYHCYSMNLTYDVDEDRFKAGQFREMKHRYFQEFFHNTLAQKIQDRGYQLEITKDGFEIAGVPQSLRDKFSRRSQQIGQHVAKNNLLGREGFERAWQDTREDKNDILSRAELHDHWRSRFDIHESQTLAQVLQNRDKAFPVEPMVTASQAVQWSIDHNFAGRSVVDVKQLLADALHYGIGQVDAGDVKRELQQSGLIVEERHGRRKATLPELKIAEEFLLDTVERGRGQADPLGGYGYTFHKPHDRPLNSDQVKAVTQINTSHDAVMVLRGSPGTGKSSLLKTAVEQMLPYTRVFAFTPTTAARDLLQQDGFEAHTLAMLLKNSELQSSIRGSVMIIDEAGMVGTRTMRQLVILAQKQDARLILVGDDKQNPPIEAGRPFKLLVERSGLPVMEVREIVRQKDAAYRDAVMAVDHGDTGRGLDQLDRLGWVHEQRDDAKRYSKLAHDYVQIAMAHPYDPKAVLAIAPTHREKDMATQAIRSALREQGQLKEADHTLKKLEPIFATEAERSNPQFLREHLGDTVHFYQNAKGGFIRGSRATITRVDTDRSVWATTPDGKQRQLPTDTPSRYQLYRNEEIAVAVGDRLRLVAPGRTIQGSKISGGSFVTVKAFTASGDLIVDKNKTLAKDFGMIDHGYTITAMSSQGQTVRHLLLAQSSELSYPASFLHQFLVSISRAKDGLRIYTDDKEQLAEAVRRRDPELFATDFGKQRQSTGERSSPNWQEHQQHRHRIRSVVGQKAKLAVDYLRRQVRAVGEFLIRPEREITIER